MKYEMVAHSETFDDILDKINEMPKPLGIMVFGIDSDLKNMIVNKIIQNSKKLFGQEIRSRRHFISTCHSVDRIEVTISNGDKSSIGGVLTMLSGDDSTRHGERHRAVMGMQSDGMQSIVGVYVEIDVRSLQANPDLSKSIKQQAILEAHPPTADGLTALVTVSTSL